MGNNTSTDSNHNKEAEHMNPSERTGEEAPQTDIPMEDFSSKNNKLYYSWFDVHELPALEKKLYETIRFATGELRSDQTICFEEQSGSVLKTKDMHGKTLLHIAAHYNRTDILPILLKYIDVNDRDINGWTALLEAANHDAHDAIVFLLDQRAEISATIEDGSTALHLMCASNERNIKTLRLLLDRGVNVNAVTKDYGINAIHEFVNRARRTTDDAEALQLLIEHKANINKTDQNGETPLNYALISKNAFAAGILLKAGTDLTLPHNKGRTALHHAMRFLDDTIDDYNDCFIDSDVGNVVDALISRIRDVPDILGKDALQFAVEYGKFGFVKYLISKGGNVSTRSKEGYTLLHTCAMFNRSQVAEYLVNQNCTLYDYRDNVGKTAMHYAAQHSNIDMIQLLGRNGANCNLQSYDGSTPAHLAVNTRNLDVMDALLKLGASMKIRNTKRHNVLEHAMFLNDSDMVRYLFQEDASVSLLEHNSFGNPKISEFSATVLDVALDSCIKRDGDNKMYVNYKGARFILSIFSVCLILKEILQCCTNWRYYVTNIENYFEWGFIVTMLLIMFEISAEIDKHVAAAANILIGISLTLMIGRHPKASKAVQLLKTVTYQFSKYFLAYILIILSFALSFYQLFGISSKTMVEPLEPLANSSSLPGNVTATLPRGESKIDSSKSESKINVFDPSFIMLQTILMMLGEYSIDSDATEQYTVINVIIISIFLLFVSTIMVNLLNGLAVSNILGEKELQISKYKSQIEYVYFTIKSLQWFNQKLFYNILCLFAFFEIFIFGKILLTKLIPNAVDNEGNIYIKNATENFEKVYILFNKETMFYRIANVKSRSMHQAAIAIYSKKMTFEGSMLHAKLDNKFQKISDNISKLENKNHIMLKTVCNNLKEEIKKNALLKLNVRSQISGKVMSVYPESDLRQGKSSKSINAEKIEAVSNEKGNKKENKLHDSSLPDPIPHFENPKDITKEQEGSNLRLNEMNDFEGRIEETIAEVQSKIIELDSKQSETQAIMRNIQNKSENMEKVLNQVLCNINQLFEEIKNK